MIVLGVDPGQQTGLAWVEDGPNGFRLRGTRQIALDALANWPLLAPGGATVAFAVVEDWEYQGAARARGVTHQAHATGYACGVLEARGVDTLRVTRTKTLEALGFRRGRKAGKTAVARHVRRLVPPITPEVGAVERSEHEWDAVAVAVAGLGALNEQRIRRRVLEG